MIAFHGDIEIKNNLLKQLQIHYDFDEIVKGIYWENGKGCAVGCTIHSNEHKEYEIKLGIPKILAKFEDRIFENLPNELAKTWPIRFIESINVAADLSKIWMKFMIFLLTDKSQCNSIHPQCKIVANFLQKQLNGEIVNWSEIKSATTIATTADAYAAAAYAAYAAGAYNIAKEKSFIHQSEKLLELLSEEK